MMRGIPFGGLVALSHLPTLDALTPHSSPACACVSALALRQMRSSAPRSLLQPVVVPLSLLNIVPAPVFILSVVCLVTVAAW